MSPYSAPGEAGELAKAFALLHDQVAAGGDRATTLQGLVDLAVSSVPGCAWATLTEWPQRRQPRSAASSDEVATEADRLQYQAGEGPALTAASGEEAVHVADLTTDNRWPILARAVAKASPVRGVASFHVLDEPARTALTLYSPDVGGIDAEAGAEAAMFGAGARILLMHHDATSKAHSLTAALHSSREIGMAVGILMNSQQLTEEAAFNLLVATSQHLNRKLRDIASTVTLTGALPTSAARGWDVEASSVDEVAVLLRESYRFKRLLRGEGRTARAAQASRRLGQVRLDHLFMDCELQTEGDPASMLFFGELTRGRFAQEYRGPGLQRFSEGDVSVTGVPPRLRVRSPPRSTGWRS